MSKYIKTQLHVTPTEKGESIEETLRRLTANKQPIPDDVPVIFTPAEEGVIGDYDIRHDRFDTAYEATDKFAASKTARSNERGEIEEEKTNETDKNE